MRSYAALVLAAVQSINAETTSPTATPLLRDRNVAVDCDQNNHQRRLCRPDRECVAGARVPRARHRGPRRVAVLLRGVAFRNWGSRETEGSCCEGTQAQQRAVVESLNERLFAPLEALNFEVDVYLSTYRCSNGKPWVEHDLLPQLAPRLRGLYIGAEANTTQTKTFARALELAATEASSREDQPGDFPSDRAFEHVFILRLDMALTRSNLTCLLGQDGPMTDRDNPDQFTYLPGRYFACAVRVRHAMPFHHKWVARILSLSGVNRPSGPLLYGESLVGKGCPDNCHLAPCALQWQQTKLSAEETWRLLEDPEAKARTRAECYIARRPSKEYAPPPPSFTTATRPRRLLPLSAAMATMPSAHAMGTCPPILNASRLAAEAGDKVRRQYCRGAAGRTAVFAMAPKLVVVLTGHLRSANETVPTLYANVVDPARRAGADVAVVYHVWKTVGDTCEGDTLDAIHMRGAFVYREDAACSKFHPNYPSQVRQHADAMRNALRHAPSPWSLVLRARTDVEFKVPLDLLDMACAWSSGAGTHFAVIGGGRIKGCDIVFFGTAYVATVFAASQRACESDESYDLFPLWRLGRAGLWRDPGWRHNDSAFEGPVPWKLTGQALHAALSPASPRRKNFESLEDLKEKGEILEARRVAPLYEYDFGLNLVRDAPCTRERFVGRNETIDGPGELRDRGPTGPLSPEMSSYCKEKLSGASSFNQPLHAPWYHEESESE